MGNLSDIMKMIFTDRKSFQNLSDEDKSKWGFIVNRMLSKKYPEYAQKLNIRQGDFTMILNLWWLYIGYRPDRNYNRWIWESGSKGKTKIDKESIQLIQDKYTWITIYDIEYLYNWYQKDFKEEIKYLKKLKEDYG
jgi:hypothetical protein